MKDPVQRVCNLLKLLIVLQAGNILVSVAILIR
jgi:hypothetical protein